MEGLDIRSYARIYRPVNHKAKTKQAAKPDTVDRLLDAAERLFGELGYNGVGMRALADAAQVSLGAATYHFGSKEALYVETFMRRFRVTNDEQMTRLRAAEEAAKGRALEVECIVECLIRPPFQMGLTHPAFNQLLARNLLTPPSFIDPAIRKEAEPNVNAFAEALSRALPDIPPLLLELRIMFSMGSLLMLAVHPEHRKWKLEGKQSQMILLDFMRSVSAGIQTQPATEAAQWKRSNFPWLRSGG